MIEASTGGPRAVWADGENLLSCRGSLVRLLVTGEDTEGRISVVETLVRKGSEPHSHVHTREDLVVYVLEGLVSYYAGGEWLNCPQGTLVHLPKGSEHTFSVKSDEVRLLTILVPAGLEGYYREMDDRNGASQAGTPAFERLVTVAARYGVEIAVLEAGTGVEQSGAGMKQDEHAPTR